MRPSVPVTMSRLREVFGVLLLVAALGTLFSGVMNLRAHDYVAAILLSVMGLALLGAGVELLRPTVGE